MWDLFISTFPLTLIILYCFLFFFHPRLAEEYKEQSWAAMSELEKELQQIEAQYGEEFGDASESEEEENNEVGGGQWDCVWDYVLLTAPCVSSGSYTLTVTCPLENVPTHRGYRDASMLVLCLQCWCRLRVKHVGNKCYLHIIFGNETRPLSVACAKKVNGLK